MDLITRAKARAQGLTHYFTGNPCKRGHIAPHYISGFCVECRRLKGAEYHQNRLQALSTDPERKERRREKHKKASIRWNQMNRDRVDANNKRWRDSNPEKARAMEQRSRAKRTESGYTKQYSAMKRKTDAHFRMKNALHLRVWKAVKHQRAGKAGKTEELLGCTYQEARDHIAAQFLPGMTWENHGEWEIDHIRPCASFDLTDPEQQRECFHHANLQPLWKSENRRKQARLDWAPQCVALNGCLP